MIIWLKYGHVPKQDLKWNNSIIWFLAEGSAAEWWMNEALARMWGKLHGELETSVSFSMCAAEQWVMRSNSWQIKSGVTSSTNKLTSNKVAWLNTFRLISAPKSSKELLLHLFSPDNVILSFQIWCQYKLWFAEIEPHFVPERDYKSSFKRTFNLTVVQVFVLCSWGDNHSNVIKPGLIKGIILLRSSDSSLPPAFSQINILYTPPTNRHRKSPSLSWGQNRQCKLLQWPRY